MNKKGGNLQNIAVPAQDNTTKLAFLWLCYNIPKLIVIDTVSKSVSQLSCKKGPAKFGQS